MGNSKARKKGQKVGSKKLRRYRRIWERLIAEHSRKLLIHARKLAGAQNAADVLNEVFLRVWKYVPNPTLIANHRAFLMRITRNVANDFRPDPQELSLEEVMMSDPTKTGLVTEPRILELLTAFEGLEKDAKTEKARLRAELRCQGLTFQQIADYLGEDVNHARYEWYKARREAREKAERQSRKH